MNFIFTTHDKQLGIIKNMSVHLFPFTIVCF